MNPVETSLQKLLAATPPVPSAEMPIDQVIALADSVAKEREPIFKQISDALQNGARMTDRGRALLAQLEQMDRAWRARLGDVRSTLEGRRDQPAVAPRRHLAAYRSP